MALAILAAAAAFFGVLFVIIGYFQAGGGFALTQQRRRLEKLEIYTAPSIETSVPLALRQQGSAWAEHTKTDLSRAGLALKLHEYMAFRVLVAVAAFALVLLVGNSTGLAVAIGLAAAGVAFMVPAFFVRRRIAKQVDRFNDQLDEMLTMVSNSLRAGFGLLQAFDLAAEQSQPPMSTELHRLLRDTRMGSSLETALEKLGERVGSYDLDVVITAMLIQRSVGSNLSEVLEKVAHTIRERARIKGEINTLTAQKRLSGWIIGLMPAAFVVIMTAISFDYMSVLFTDPAGRMLLLLAVILDTIGIMIIRRIVSVDI
jgi:tight adherence protein B